MKIKKIRADLEKAKNSAIELSKKAKGEKSSCGCKNFEEIPLYVDTWIVAIIENALREIK
jgi:hypothetical protein